MSTTPYESDGYEATKLVSTSLIIVVLIASLFSSLKTENKSVSTRGVSVGVIFAVAMLYLYHLVPIVFMQLARAGVYHFDCLNSRKGGKRPFGSIADEYKNPCFALYNTTFFSSTDNNTKLAKEANELTNIHRHNMYSSICASTNLDETDVFIPELYISVVRDCQNAQRGLCSLSEPCTPCELSRFDEFHNSHHEWSRCQACAPVNKYGDCNFVDNVGPYCWKDTTSSGIVPCTKCCTDQVPIFDDNGKCH